MTRLSRRQAGARARSSRAGLRPRPWWRRPAVLGSAAIVAAAVLVTCILVLPGGGGSPPKLPATDLVARVNGICSSYAEKVEALAAPSFTPASATKAELGTVARYLENAVPLLQSEDASIKAAGTPTTDRSLYDSMLTALASHVHDEQAAETAAQSGDIRAFRAALSADQAASTRLSGIGQQLGVTECLSS